MSEQNKKAQDTKVQPKQVRDSQPSGSSAAAAGEGLPQAPEQGAEQIAGQAEIPDELKVLREKVAKKEKELKPKADELQQAWEKVRVLEQELKELRQAGNDLQHAQQKVKGLEQELKELRRASDDPPKVQERIRALEERNAELWKEGSRLQSEQQPAEQAREDAQKKGIQLLAESLLPCVASLEQALASPPQPGDEALRQGLQMTLGDLKKVLDPHDIKPDHPEGEDLQPSEHHASATSQAPAGRSEPEKETVLKVPQRTAETPKQTPKADGESKAERQNHKE